MRYRRLRAAGGIYAFTVVTRERKPIFVDEKSVALLLAVVADIQQRRPFVVDAYAILPDHAHMGWTLPDGDSDFSTRMMLVKKSFTRLYRDRICPRRMVAMVRSKSSPVWQNRFWEHLVSDDRDYIAQIEYIHQNPVRHGLVAMPIEWPHSSFRGFVELGDYPANWENRDLPDAHGAFGE